MHDTLKPYDYLGVEIRKVERDNALLECVFCNHHSRKFSVKFDTGQFRCLNCEQSGNLYTFLTRFHERLLERTTTDDYKELASNRFGIPWTMFRDHRFAAGPHGSATRWIIPVNNRKGTIISLQTYIPGHPIFGVAGLPIQLMGLERLSPKGPIYLVEGKWDQLAFLRLLRKARQKGSVLSSPGCGVFKDEWVQHFKGRDVVICYDNDPSGEAGAEKACVKIQPATKTVRILRWPSETPEKWDIRDLVHLELDRDKSDPKETFTALKRLFQVPSHLLSTIIPTSDSDQSPALLDLPKRTSFITVIKDFKDHYHMERTMVDGLSLMYAVVLSVQLPGDPIWMFITAPPGSGKTMLLKCFKLSNWCVFRSSITPKSLVSGYVTADGSDPSLIPQLIGKALILKDYTEITTMARESQEEIYGILRGAYDGYVEKTFGNGLIRVYDPCHFSIIAGVTDIIHGDDRASLGERFLKYQLVIGQEHDATENIMAAITGMADQLETEKFLQRVTVAFLQSRDLTQIKIPQPEPWLIKRIISLTQVIAHLRATVPHIGNRGEIAYRPAPEIGTRLAKQLMKLGQCLAIVHGKKRIDMDCWRLMLRVALDTAKGWNLDIFLILAKHYPDPILREVVIHEGNISPTTTHRRMEGMKIMNTITHRPIHTGQPGHPSHGWTLTPEIATLWKNVVK